MNTIGTHGVSAMNGLTYTLVQRTSPLRNILEKITSSFWGRYALAIGSFAILLAISLLLSYLNIKVSLTILILVGLVVTAWYGGLGPGILMAVLIVGATVVLQGRPADISPAKYVFAQFSNFALIIFIVVLIHSRKVAEVRLESKSAQLQHLNETLEHRVGERTAELEFANRELESFSYSVSHDLRAPLRAIDSFSEALLDDHENHLDEEGKVFLSNIRGATVTMNQLIDDMLQLATVAQDEINRSYIDLSNIAREVIEDLKQREPDRRVECRIQDGVTAFADERLVRLALSNLIHNAWKFTSKQPAAQISFGMTQTDEQSEFFVRDNGAGFDMAFADKLFRPFERLHSADEFEGTGIGLATVQRVIQKHGGVIRGVSKPGEGAEFVFTF